MDIGMKDRSYAWAQQHGFHLTRLTKLLIWLNARSARNKKKNKINAPEWHHPYKRTKSQLVTSWIHWIFQLGRSFNACWQGQTHILDLDLALLPTVGQLVTLLKTYPVWFTSVILYNIDSDKGVHFKETRWRNGYLIPNHKFIGHITYHTKQKLLAQWSSLLKV